MKNLKAVHSFLRKTSEFISFKPFNMKVLQIIVFLLFLGVQTTLGQGFYYFGNSNLVGTGKIVGTSKEGVWKIYARKQLADNPTSAVAEVNEKEVMANFNLAFPLYQMEFKKNQIDGVFEEFFPEGMVNKLVNYQAGLLHGDFFEFGKNGELLLSGSYFQGEKTGDWFVYRGDGTVKSEYSYQNNLLHGISTTYFSPGQVAERIPFEMGEINGVYESFFSDGSAKQRVAFVAGQEQGRFEQFHTDGKLAIVANFSKGILDGIWEDYDDQGRLLSKGMYQQGDRVGEWKEIYPELPGFYTTGNYQAGKKDGTWKVLGVADFVHQEEIFQKDILVAISAFTTRSGLVLDAGDMARGDGRRTIFDGEGHRLAKGRYANGLRAGTWYSYFPQTNLVASSGSYVAGQKRGTWKQFDFSGQLVSEEFISSGQSADYKDLADPLEGASGTARSRFYQPVQPNKVGMAHPRFMVLPQSGGVGVPLD